MSDHEMRPLYCDEHGEVMRATPLRTTGVEASWTMFCPICSRELFPDDPLTEIERQGKDAATFEEWKAREDVPVLDMGTLAVGEDDA